LEEVKFYDGLWERQQEVQEEEEEEEEEEGEKSFILNFPL
jgi:hypothetical protein